MQIALVTYHDAGQYPGEGATEDAQLHQYLTRKNLQVNFEIWTEPQVPWQQYHAVILKSPWDYFDKIEAFMAWLDLLEALKVKTLNPVPVVRWNTNKKYLLDIEKAGFAIVPTAILPQQTTFVAATYFEQWQTKTLIVKPAVSGGAKNTFSISVTNAAELETQINFLLNTEDYLVQPFIPEVKSQGEWSLLFFNGKFSHAVRKLPKAGDFRVQHYFGGAIIPATPSPAVLDYAQNLVNKFAAGCLYARVDGINSNGNFRLMELELIEPLLYLQNQPQHYQNYYQALRQLM